MVIPAILIIRVQFGPHGSWKKPDNQILTNVLILAFLLFCVKMEEVVRTWIHHSGLNVTAQLNIMVQIVLQNTTIVFLIVAVKMDFVSMVWGDVHYSLQKINDRDFFYCIPFCFSKGGRPPLVHTKKVSHELYKGLIYFKPNFQRSGVVNFYMAVS